MRIFLLLLVVIITSSCSIDEKPINDQNIVLIFGGDKNNYSRKGSIKYVVTDEKVDSVISRELQNMEFIWLYNTTGIIWAIDIYGKNGRLVCQLIYNFDDDYIFVMSGIGLGLKKQKWGKNDVLFNYLKDLFKVDKIGAYPGPMNQEIYDRVILKKYIPPLPDSSMH